MPTGGEKPHAPVFILVSGHMERGVDARQLWGANGFLHSVVDTAVQAAVQATTVAVSEVVETVEAVSSNTAVVDSEGKGMGAGASDADQGRVFFFCTAYVSLLNWCRRLCFYINRIINLNIL